MSKSLYVKILLPIDGYDEERIYDESEIDLDCVYGEKVLNDRYFRRLKERSSYATFDDIKKYAAKKYSLGEVGDCALQYGYDGSETLLYAGNRYEIEKEEIETLKKPHINEHTYCRIHKEFSVDVYLSMLSDLVPDGPVLIDNSLIDKAIQLLTDEFDNEEEDVLEDFFEYGNGYEGKLIASMLVAQKIAERVNGIAILEYD